MLGSALPPAPVSETDRPPCSGGEALALILASEAAAPWPAAWPAKVPLLPHLPTTQSPARSFSHAAGPGRGLGLREGQRGTPGHIANRQLSGLQHPAPGPNSPGWGTLGAYHEERPFGLGETDDHDQWDTHHGGEGQAPAQPDGPGRVRVDFVVGQGYVLDKREDKTPLWGDKRRSGASGARAGPTRGAHTLPRLLTERLPCSEPPDAPQGLLDASPSSGQQCLAPCPLPPPAQLRSGSPDSSQCLSPPPPRAPWDLWAGCSRPWDHLPASSLHPVCPHGSSGRETACRAPDHPGGAGQDALRMNHKHAHV